MTPTKVVKVQVGDQTYGLRFDQGSVAQLEDDFDLPFGTLLGKLGKVSIKTVAAVIVVGSAHDAKPADYDTVFAALHPAKLAPITDAIIQAFRIAGWVEEPVKVVKGEPGKDVESAA